MDLVPLRGFEYAVMCFLIADVSHFSHSCSADISVDIIAIKSYTTVQTQPLKTKCHNFDFIESKRSFIILVLVLFCEDKYSSVFY